MDGMGASVSQRGTTDDVPCLCFSMSGARGDTFTFSAVRSTAESYLLKCSETFLHTVHANFLSNPYCAMDRWATIISPSWIPVVEVFQRVCQLDQLVFGSCCNPWSCR